ncbi:MAG: Holliday junction resolvase RuvX [Malacoplasma sp.]|nr:Holliday junction resolvase RuvX [Malacoplasma sp.]MDE6563053.1 Holliday junction resolvase RuvX [Malacoplasma sp.]
MQLKGKVLAIDFGTKILGIAISDNEQKLCLPYCQLKNNNNLFKKIIEIIEEEKVIEIVIGFPKTNNGYVSQRHQLIIDFKKTLDDKLQSKITTTFFDESFSTKSSYDSLKSFNVKTSKLDKNKDMIAASIILENYLNSKNKSR